MFSVPLKTIERELSGDEGCVGRPLDPISSLILQTHSFFQLLFP